MDKDQDGKKFKLTTKENIMNVKSNKNKIMTSKFFTPMPAIPSIELRPKKTVLTKKMGKSREMYRDRIICSEEVSRKKLKLDKEKTEIIARRPDEETSKSPESDEEFFEKIRQKCESDKAKGLLVQGSQQKKVKKIKKLFSDDCVKLMNKFKEACKNSLPADNATKIPKFNSTENSEPNENSLDNFSIQTNYPSEVFNINNSAYQNNLKIPDSSTFTISSPSFYNDQEFLTELERDKLMSDLEYNLETPSLHNQLLSFSSVKTPEMSPKMRTASNFPKFSIPQFSIDDTRNDESFPLTPFRVPSPIFNNIHDNNNSSINYFEYSMGAKRSKKFFEK
ncbi:uncharacterized protein LOC123259129 [Cotesia glomerata]|uniref:Uncharacterized protein n=1 Tax=Cotesia glomerata TaxID=32391 RepID=A0AAV7I281_COTGL|nr:uncharacterized protein LOC123259129 [Cotesia glomerata]KAH0539769.1 hypothetical protein KQX54_007945 [Cotesia glomerata]